MYTRNTSVPYYEFVSKPVIEMHFALNHFFQIGQDQNSDTL